MSLAQLLADHGYLAVFVGSLLEGETILVLAGFAAHQGLLSLPLTLTIAFIGGTLGDQFFFWLGHTWGTSLMRRIPGSVRRVRRVRELLSRYDALLIVGIRFMYGLRIIGPIAMGTGGVSAGRFARYNVLGAAIWALLVGGLGYLFGDALEVLLGDVGRYQETVLLLIVIVPILFALWRRWMGARARGLPR